MSSGLRLLAALTGIGEEERRAEEVDRLLAMIEPRVRMIAREEIGKAKPRECMSAEDVAQWLGVDRKTVYDAAGRKDIPHQKIGKRLLFSRSALMAWLGGCKTASFRKGQ